MIVIVTKNKGGEIDQACRQRLASNTEAKSALSALSASHAVTLSRQPVSPHGK